MAEMRRRLLWMMGGLLLAGGPALALERKVETQVVNVEGVPVVVETASTRLVQTYGRMSQFPLAAVGREEVRIARSRVKYMNQLNQQVPTYQLQGEAVVRNGTRSEVVALQLTVVSFNAFQERLAIDRHTLTEPVGPLKTDTIRWSQALSHPDVFELYVVVTGARFKDGTVWTADEEELVFEP